MRKMRTRETRPRPTSQTNCGRRRSGGSKRAVSCSGELSESCGTMERNAEAPNQCGYGGAVCWRGFCKAAGHLRVDDHFYLSGGSPPQLAFQLKFGPSAWYSNEKDDYWTPSENSAERNYSHGLSHCGKTIPVPRASPPRRFERASARRHATARRRARAGQRTQPMTSRDTSQADHARRSRAPANSPPQA